ncbi:hypothetical protein PG999_002899 [Apiospora kogelbergensis]|uniref:Uncharacterized protein n=1 Tax=Apiospora kogelbergensis TaxID=1337665 RepID=A0AAW0R9N5_9PEZI
MTDKNNNPFKSVVINDRDEGTESRLDRVQRLYLSNRPTPPKSSSSVLEATHTPASRDFPATKGLATPAGAKTNHVEEGGPAQTEPNPQAAGAPSSEQKNSTGGNRGVN